MKTIALTQGKTALVDDSDYDDLLKTRWRYHKDGYAVCNFTLPDNRRTAKTMHRIIFNAPDGFIVDHINGDKLDNRRENLRLCNVRQSGFNVPKRKSASQYKGVHWNKRDKKWYAHIGVDGKLKHLGYYDQEVDAAIAYNKAAEKLHGEFARLNIIQERQVKL